MTYILFLWYLVIAFVIFNTTYTTLKHFKDAFIYSMIIASTWAISLPILFIMYIIDIIINGR